MSKDKIVQLSALAQQVRAALSSCQATAKIEGKDNRDYQEVLVRLNKAVNEYALEYSRPTA